MIDYTAKDIGTIGNFRFWCQKVLPAVYDDSLSYYELLCKVVDYLNNVIDEVNVHSDAIRELQEKLVELQQELDEFKESGFDEYYKEKVEQWINDNLQYIYKYTIKQIFFSLDESGYLIAHVPEGWNQIQFSTPMLYSDQSSYGRLCLTYAFDEEMAIYI